MLIKRFQSYQNKHDVSNSYAKELNQDYHSQISCLRDNFVVDVLLLPQKMFHTNARQSLWLESIT